MADLDPMWHWVREREQIRVRKERGDPPPWTDDPILAEWRFCCVRREDDRVTRWIRDHVRVPYAGHPHLWLMLCICRQINWPDTLGELIARGAWPTVRDFDADLMATVLRERRDRGDKVYTGAYVISAPPTRGADKQAYVAGRVVGSLWDRRGEFEVWRGRSLRVAHELICRSPGWGAFMAYQAVVDMRFCPDLLGHASDRETWAAAGPGTIRGLNRVHGRPVDATLTQGRALEEMLAIHRQVADVTGVEVDLSDVPNVLCETDKYLRVARGEGKPRARYSLGAGADQVTHKRK